MKSILAVEVDGQPVMTLVRYDEAISCFDNVPCTGWKEWHVWEIYEDGSAKILASSRGGVL